MLNFNNSLTDGFKYDPNSGILIGGNLLTFLICLLIVGILFAILAKPLKLNTEFSDVAIVGILFAAVCIMTRNIPYIRGDLITVSILFNILSIFLRRILKSLGIDTDTVIIVTNFTMMLYILIKNEFTFWNILYVLRNFRIVVQLLNMIGLPL